MSGAAKPRGTRPRRDSNPRKRPDGSKSGSSSSKSGSADRKARDLASSGSGRSTGGSSSRSATDAAAAAAPKRARVRFAPPTEAALLSQLASKHGYLKKQADNEPGKWTKYYFVLKPSTYLYYYNTPDDTEPRGVIDLEFLQDVRFNVECLQRGVGGSDHCFRVTGQMPKEFTDKSDKTKFRPLYLDTESRTEAEEWMDAFQNHRFDLERDEEYTQLLQSLECADQRLTTLSSQANEMASVTKAILLKGREYVCKLRGVEVDDDTGRPRASTSAEEDIANALSSIDSLFDEIFAEGDQQARLITQLRQREAELRERDADFRKREADFKSQGDGYHALERKIESQKREIDRQKREIERQEKEMESMSDDFRSREAELEKKQRAAEKRQKELDKKLKELDKEIDKRTKEMDKDSERRQKEFDKKQKEIEKKQKELEKKLKSADKKSPGMKFAAAIGKLEGGKNIEPADRDGLDNSLALVVAPKKSKGLFKKPGFMKKKADTRGRVMSDNQESEIRPSEDDIEVPVEVEVESEVEEDDGTIETVHIVERVDCRVNENNKARSTTKVKSNHIVKKTDEEGITAAPPKRSASRTLAHKTSTNSVEGLSTDDESVAPPQSSRVTKRENTKKAVSVKQTREASDELPLPATKVSQRLHKERLDPETEDDDQNQPIQAAKKPRAKKSRDKAAVSTAESTDDNGETSDDSAMRQSARLNVDKASSQRTRPVEDLGVDVASPAIVTTRRDSSMSCSSRVPAASARDENSVTACQSSRSSESTASRSSHDRSSTGTLELDSTLPKGWTKRESRSSPGEYYYVHNYTGETSWELPTVEGVPEEGDEEDEGVMIAELDDEEGETVLVAEPDDEESETGVSAETSSVDSKQTPEQDDLDDENEPTPVLVEGMTETRAVVESDQSDSDADDGEAFDEALDFAEGVVSGSETPTSESGRVSYLEERTHTPEPVGKMDDLVSDNGETIEDCMFDNPMSPPSSPPPSPPNTPPSAVRVPSPVNTQSTGCQPRASSPRVSFRTSLQRMSLRRSSPSVASCDDIPRVSSPVSATQGRDSYADAHDDDDDHDAEDEADDDDDEVVEKPKGKTKKMKLWKGKFPKLPKKSRKLALLEDGDAIEAKGRSGTLASEGAEDPDDELDDDDKKKKKKGKLWKGKLLKMPKKPFGKGKRTTSISSPPPESPPPESPGVGSPNCFEMDDGRCEF